MSATATILPGATATNSSSITQSGSPSTVTLAVNHPMGYAPAPLPFTYGIGTLPSGFPVQTVAINFGGRKSANPWPRRPSLAAREEFSRDDDVRARLHEVEAIGTAGGPTTDLSFVTDFVRRDHWQIRLSTSVLATSQFAANFAAEIGCLTQVLNSFAGEIAEIEPNR